MSLNATALENQILDILVREMRSAFPTKLKGVDIVEVPKEDGTTGYTVTPQYGPNEFDPETSRPLARAIAEAVVQHITAHAQVTCTGGGGTWRVS